MTRDDIREIAFRDFLTWAISEPEMVAAFDRDTGRTLGGKPKNGLEMVIDEATGKLNSDVFAFMLWVTEHHWGIDEAPAKIRALFAERTPS